MVDVILKSCDIEKITRAVAMLFTIDDERMDAWMDKEQAIALSNVRTMLNDALTDHKNNIAATMNGSIMNQKARDSQLSFEFTKDKRCTVHEEWFICGNCDLEQAFEVCQNCGMITTQTEFVK